jgi:hypothetical protein
VGNRGKSVWRAHTFALRKVYLEPFQPSTPDNGPSGENLALVPGARAISKSTHFGSLCGLNCSDFIAYGDTLGSEDDFDGSPKMASWWGYEWPRSYNFNEVVYETGKMSTDADGMRHPLACRFTVIFTGSMSPA